MTLKEEGDILGSKIHAYRKIVKWRIIGITVIPMLAGIVVGYPIYNVTNLAIALIAVFVTFTLTFTVCVNFVYKYLNVKTDETKKWIKRLDELTEILHEYEGPILGDLRGLSTGCIKIALNNLSNNTLEANEEESDYDKIEVIPAILSKIIIQTNRLKFNDKISKDEYEDFVNIVNREINSNKQTVLTILGTNINMNNYKKRCEVISRIGNSFENLEKLEFTK